MLRGIGYVEGLEDDQDQEPDSGDPGREESPPR